MSDDDDILAAARDGFLAEALEMLAQFEQSLLAMEDDTADADAVNGAFRAAHTIKGGAGLFGFDDVVAFTHEVESALDEVRAGTLALDDALMAALLESKDRMAALVEAIGGPVPEPEAGDALVARLRERRGAAAPAAASASTSAHDAPAASGAAAGTWHVSLQMGVDALRNGLDPISFIRYLETLGRVAGIRTLEHRLPELQELDPESCLVGFEIRLESAASRAEIEGVFDFLRDDCDLVVLAPDAGPADYEALLERRASSDEAAREHVLSHWQVLAGPGKPPFIERRREDAAADRREAEPERRSGAKDRRAGDETRFVRVRADKLDELVDLIGELVIASSGAQMVAHREQSPAFAEAAQRIHDLVQETRDGALGLRMVPIGDTFARFHRVVRDVGKQLSKDIELQVSGGDAELDKAMVETIADPLMHLVRNSMDHGIESAEARRAAGKPARGRLGLHAYHEAGAIVIEVSDDGGGLNRGRIRAKAVERGLIDADAVLEDDAVDQLIFHPGFSTAEQVTNLSGRGVGMDVVKKNVESLRGQIRVISQPGLGTTTQIRLPLTLAIIDGFLAQVGRVAYVVPLEIVAECIETPGDLRPGEDAIAGCFDLRGETVPYLDLRAWLGHDHEPPARRSLLVVHVGVTRLGLLVDRLLGEHQTVIKPLAPIFAGLRGLAGSTILGSGEVGLILDVAALMQVARARLDTRRTVKPGALRGPA